MQNERCALLSARCSLHACADDNRTRRRANRSFRRATRSTRTHAAFFRPGLREGWWATVHCYAPTPWHEAQA